MMEKWLGMPIQASTHAAQIDQMTVLVHWLMLVLFIGWGAFFIFVLFRFRRGAHPRADTLARKGKFAKSTEIAVAVIEIVLLVGYAIPAWALRVKAFPSASEAVVVRLVGEQFAWNVHYPGPDGRFGKHRYQARDRRQSARSGSPGSGCQGRHHHDQPDESAGRSSDSRAAFEQGRHPQPRLIECA
jgi:heme/copper-type cytochrome/quinol oxidase subunit 2